MDGLDDLLSCRARGEAKNDPPGEDECVCPSTIVVERGPRPVRIPPVELDGDLQLRVGQIDLASSAVETHPKLLPWRRQPAGDEPAENPRLKIAVAGVVAVESRGQEGVNDGRAPPWSRRKSTYATMNGNQPQAMPKLVVENSPKQVDRQTCGHVDDCPRRRRRRNQSAHGSVLVEEERTSMSDDAVESNNARQFSADLDCSLVEAGKVRE